MQVAYDGVKRDNKWMGGREWHARRYTGGGVTSGFRMGQGTEDNLFMLERMIEMAKVRRDCLFVAFIDMEKTHDRVNRKKLFDVMRGYGVQEILVDVIERIYSGSMVKFVLAYYHDCMV